MKKIKSNSNRIILVLGGGLARDKNGTWRTTNFDEGDNFGVSGDRLRVEAAKYLYNNKIKQEYIILGGQGQLKGVLGKETISGIMKKELMALGVPGKIIKTEKKSGNTFQQLKEGSRLLSKMKFEKNYLISNKCHIPRIRAMIEYSEELEPLKELLERKNLELLSAESIAIKHKPDIWEKAIKEAYSSPAMKARIALEKKGVKEIKEGRYKFK